MWWRQQVLGSADTAWLTFAMAEPARSVRSRSYASGVVRPLSRVAHRRCSRPGCPTPATVTLVFQYEARLAQLLVLQDGGPETYDLCGDHANRTNPPVGWTLQDDRPDDPGATPEADDLASPQTVAVLAAALRRDTDRDVQGPSDTAVVADGVDTAALDAIVDQALADDDLLGTADEPGLDSPVADLADTDEDTSTGTSVDALTELSALCLDASSDLDSAPAPSSGRTVPAARRSD